MKKFSRILVPAALFVIGGAVANAADFVVDGLRYTTLTENTASVLKYIEGSDIQIPSKVTDPSTSTEYSVVQIERQAFYNTSDLRSISIPATVKSIDTYAFWKSGVETVTLSEGLESIGHAAFKECVKLVDINLPSTLVELGKMWDVTGNDGSTFALCSALKKIEIPASIQHLPQLTFSECSSLSNVILNEGTTSIGERAFEGCSSLTSIEMPRSVVTWERAIFSKSGLEHPVVPGHVKIIPNSAFLWCRDMKSFTIEEGVEEIGKASFAAGRTFTEINVPNSVEWIRSDAFQGNGSVTKVNLGSGVRRIGNASFALWEPDEMSNTPQWVLEEIHITSPVPPVYEPNDDHFEPLDADFFFGGKEFTDGLREKFYSEVRLYVPESAVEAYSTADIWKEFKNIIGEKTSDGIAEINAQDSLRIEGGIAYSDSDIEVYTVAGVRVANALREVNLNQLGCGLYIVKSGNSSLKTIVK